jgi:hypothetical protein
MKPVVGLVVIAGALIFDTYMFFLNYSERNDKIKKREARKNNEKAILLNTIAEIVDFKFLYKDGKKYQNEIIGFINSLDYRNYVKLENGARNIMVGDRNG